MEILNNPQRYCENCTCQNCIDQQSVEIEGYENYRIFRDGRVFSKKSNKFLKPNNNGRGYVYVQLFKGTSERKMKNIHRLVAEHYITNPGNLKEVDHKNRIRDDNRVENLRWVTSSENAYNKGLTKNNKLGFKWISQQLMFNKYNNYKLSRKIDGKMIIKSSNSLSKVLCYSFFYMLRFPHK